MKKYVCNLLVVVVLFFVAGCAGTSDAGIADAGDVDVRESVDTDAVVNTDAEVDNGPGIDVSEPVDDAPDIEPGVEVDPGPEVDSDPDVEVSEPVGDAPEIDAGSDGSVDLANGGDIETWLVEVGNDFPDSAKCVAEAMQNYAVSDFEKSFAGELNEPFETELDVAYEVCDALLGITSEP